MPFSKDKIITRFHGLMLIFDFGLLTALLLPVFWLTEKFVQPKNRGELWRRAGLWIVRTVFDLNELDIRVKNHKNIISPAIYTANHPSHMDGFMLLTILGPKTILFTAPLHQFPSILAFWLKKMEAVDVRRDPIDDQKYPKSNSKEDAIKKATKFLRAGLNLIIFPEGHIELLHVLHYFHSGAARISLGSHTPIVPVSIINADRVFPDEEHYRGGSVLFVFGRLLMTLKNTRSKTPLAKAAVLRLQKKIESAVVDKLPARYVPDYFEKKDKSIGVFVDIDRTIYDGLSQKDLITYLLFLHKIKAKEAFRLFYWLFLEKMRQLNHQDLMRRALLTLKGWDVAELDKTTHEIFADKLLTNVQYGFFPLLKDHAEENHSIILVSEVIHPLAKEFKKLVHARDTLDTRLSTVHHCYTGDAKCLCYKEQKALLVREFAKRANIDLKKSYAYADSSSDLPFLSLVKYPTAVNPDDSLLDYAVKHDWPIMKNAA